MAQTRPYAQVAKRNDIRRYSMTWLLHAACRVYERGVAVQAAHARRIRAGMDELFDLSDANTTGRHYRMS